MSVPQPLTPARAGSDPQHLHLVRELAVVTVRPWPDPLLEQFGHDPRSAYAERFWLPVIGPSSLWLLRLLASRFDEHPDGFTLDLREAGQAIGLGSRGGANSALAHTVGRVIQFGFAQVIDDDTLAVRRHLASLTRRQLARMPEHRQVEHDTWARPRPADPPVVDVRRRARTLALSLLDLGEDASATEHQLHRWKFHPAIAYDAVRWATAAHAERVQGAPVGQVGQGAEVTQGADPAGAVPARRATASVPAAATVTPASEADARAAAPGAAPATADPTAVAVGDPSLSDVRPAAAS